MPAAAHRRRGQRDAHAASRHSATLQRRPTAAADVTPSRERLRSGAPADATYRLMPTAGQCQLPVDASTSSKGYHYCATPDATASKGFWLCYGHHRHGHNKCKALNLQLYFYILGGDRLVDKTDCFREVKRSEINVF